MEESKKRKVDEIGNDEFLPSPNDASQNSAVEELRALLDPLAKPQLVDLLARAGFQYPSIADEIRSVASADPALRKLFVRGLAWNTTSDTLCAAFQEHGGIEEGAVIYDKITGKSRGYGFVTFTDMESAQKALKAPSKMIDGRMAVCNLASEGLSSTSTTPDQAQRKLYVGGLSPDTTSEMLLAFFARHGPIEEGSVAYDKESNKSRGFGFVTFTTVEGAKKAIDDPQKLLGGRNITVKLADNYKGKISQPQLLPTAVPVHMTGGYQHNGGGVPIPYNYPATYISPPTLAPPYVSQQQYTYPQYSVKRGSLSPQTGFPYYMHQQ